MVSFVQRSVAAICYEVEPVDGPARIVVQSELVANEQLPSFGNDPRRSATLAPPLRSEQHGARNARVELVHRTLRSELRMAAAMDHIVTDRPTCTSSRRARPTSGG